MLKVSVKCGEKSSDFLYRYLPVGEVKPQVTSGDLHTIFAPDGAFVVLRDEGDALHGVEDDFLFVGSFCYHAYTIPQITQNARDFFAISETFFVDVFSNGRFIFYDKDFSHDLARHLRR